MLANLNSFSLDFVARQKVAGLHLRGHYLAQLPIIPHHRYAEQVRWLSSVNLEDFIAPRVVELTYTAWDFEAFAEHCGYKAPPFRWDAGRSFALRCELDAAYFHLYGIIRDDVDYIMETFPIVKRKDEDEYGDYRTKRVILEIYDAMAEAIRTSQPYQTRLDPPPGPPTDGLPAWPTGAPMPAKWPPHIHPPHLTNES